MGANMLIGAIGAPLDDYFLSNILGIFSEKIFKTIVKNITFFGTIWLRFVLIFFQKFVIFKVFQVHLQVLLTINIQYTCKPN
jgi:hypothetical protein